MSFFCVVPDFEGGGSISKEGSNDAGKTEEA